jgi:hypothetical protein
MTDRPGKKLNTDNKIHSRTYRVKAALSGNLQRASYTITNMAGLVLPCRFQNSPPFASPFITNDWLCKPVILHGKKKGFRTIILILGTRKILHIVDNKPFQET